MVKRAIAGRAFDEAIELSREIGDKPENEKIPARGIMLGHLKEKLG